MGERVRSYAGIKCRMRRCKNQAVDNYLCGKHAMRWRRYGDPAYVTPKSIQRLLMREAQPSLAKVKPTTYKKFLGRHEHRVIAEIRLGRKLRKGEIVHHIDGDKHNNSPTNLEVTTQSKHIRLHRQNILVGIKKRRRQRARTLPISAKTR